MTYETKEQQRKQLYAEFLRRRNATSSLRSTLLGEAGWHRADLAEARTRDDGLKL